jgi:hypothetical protein
MYFGTKSYLKSTRNHTVKHALNKVLSLEAGVELGGVKQGRVRQYIYIYIYLFSI